MPSLNVAAVCSKVMAQLLGVFWFFEISWYYVFMPPLIVAAVCSKVKALLLGIFCFLKFPGIMYLCPH